MKRQKSEEEIYGGGIYGVESRNSKVQADVNKTEQQMIYNYVG